MFIASALSAILSLFMVSVHTNSGHALPGAVVHHIAPKTGVLTPLTGRPLPGAAVRHAQTGRPLPGVVSTTAFQPPF